MVKTFLFNTLPAIKIVLIVWTMDSGCPWSPAKLVGDECRKDSLGGPPWSKTGWCPATSRCVPVFAQSPEPKASRFVRLALCLCASVVSIREICFAVLFPGIAHFRQNFFYSVSSVRSCSNFLVAALPRCTFAPLRQIRPALFAPCPAPQATLPIQDLFVPLVRFVGNPPLKFIRVKKIKPKSDTLAE